MPPPRPPATPSIFRDLESNARQLQAHWEALVKERDDLLKERDTALQKARDWDNLFKAYTGTQDLLETERKERGEEIRQLKVEAHDAGAAASLAQKLRFTRAELARQRDAATEERNKYLQELEYIKTRPPVVNEAGAILTQLVHAKDLHERGDDEAYKKAKDGLWEKAFALLGVPMPKHLFCPACNFHHVDTDERRVTPTDEASEFQMVRGEDWTKRLHKTHLCAQCGHTWRPEERCHTVGVPIKKLAQPDALTQVLALLKLDTVAAVSPTGPLPQALVEQLDDINTVLEEAATRNLNILADKSGSDQAPHSADAAIDPVTGKTVVTIINLKPGDFSPGRTAFRVPNRLHLPYLEYLVRCLNSHSASIHNRKSGFKDDLTIFGHGVIHPGTEVLMEVLRAMHAEAILEDIRETARAKS